MIYVQDILRDIVALVSEEVTPIIKASPYAAKATGVHFMYGHEREINDRLALMSNSSKQYDKYPLIWLYTPFAISVDRTNPGFTEYSLRFIIINGSAPDMISEQRYERNFKPIIHVVMDAFIKKIDTYTIGRWKPFATGSLSYEQIDHDYWGKEQSKNTMGDHLDATELQNFKIKLTFKNC